MTRTWRIAIGIATASASSALFLLDARGPTASLGRVGLTVAIGVVLVLAGLVAGVNGERRIGILVLLAGGAWIGEHLGQAIDNGLTSTIGFLIGGAWIAFLAHAVVTFPSGRVASRIEGAVIAAGYIVTVGLTVPYLLVAPSLLRFGISQRNVFLVVSDPELAARISQLFQWLMPAVQAAVLATIGVKVARASPAVRQAYGPVWAAGAVLVVMIFGLSIALLGVDALLELAIGPWLEIAAGIVPVTLVASLFAARMAQDRLVGLVVDLETSGTGPSLRDALRRALGDPTLDIVYWQSGTGGWIDHLGNPASTPVTGEDASCTPIERAGAPIAALVHDAALGRHPERLRAAGGAAALAIENERLKAELRAQLRSVQASRARIVEAGDSERRRVERNLHDGAQQRLVALALTLRAAGSRAHGDAAVDALLEDAAGELDTALTELRLLARGLHPAIITEEGLPGALETLAERPGIPVELDVDLAERLPVAIEVGAYYVVAEALTNAARHSGAEQVTVRASVADKVLRIAVADGGRGGAAAAPGSGLEALADRVGALSGQLLVDSPAGFGTTLTVELPL